MTRVLFLDFDGVLIPLPPNGEIAQDLKSSVEAVNNLNLIVQVTGAKVVVSSAWRMGRSVEQLQELLRKWGVKWPVFDKTAETSGEEDRGAAIGRWLGDNPVEHFAILDDERTDLESFARNLVSPRASVGLQFHDAVEAIRILRG
jgi:hypothetical protein